MQHLSFLLFFWKFSVAKQNISIEQTLKKGLRAPRIGSGAKLACTCGQHIKGITLMLG